MVALVEDPEDVPDEAMLYFGTVWRSLGGQRGEGGFDPVRLPEVTGGERERERVSECECE